MKVLILLSFAAFSLSLSAQNNKGMTLANKNSTDLTGVTRAVIIGISNYLEVQSLQYADRDATVFRDYLVSKAGGGVDSSNIRLLLNEKANLGNVMAAFEWLKSKSDTNDKAIIYFSGHGDVETLTDDRNAFLLCYNTTKAVYMAGGFPVFMLKSYLTTLSKKNVQVVFIADACHSGSLSGGAIGVAQTGAVLQQQWGKEQKILSCQPEQLSQEGKQWGGGRGLFSYHFIRGLQGLADIDIDGEVTFNELMIYLAMKVPPEAKPSKQNPVFSGDAGTVLAKVDEVTLHALDEPVLASLEKTKPKGMEENLLKGVSEGTRKLYRQFEDYLEKGQTLTKDKKDAWDIYLALRDSVLSEDLVDLMKRNLAVNLQNEAQAVITVYLQGKDLDIGFGEEYNYFMDAASKMQKANELLGEQNLWSNFFKARQLFLEARAVIRTKGKGKIETDKKVLQDAINKLKTSLQIEPNAAYCYQTMGMLYSLMGDDEEAVTALNKATELTPKWAFPWLSLGNVYYVKEDSKSEENAKQYFLKSLELDSTYIVANINLGSIFYNENNLKTAKEYCFKALALNPRNPKNAVTYQLLGMIADKEGDSKSANEYYKKGKEY